MDASQIYLVTPKQIDLNTFPAQLEEAIAGGPIAALLIDCDTKLETELQAIAQTIATIAQKNDIAVVLRGDSRVAGRTKCDGLHLDGNQAEIEAGVEDYANRFMLGAEGGVKRHPAMERGESGIDYIMFGRLDAEEEATIHEKSFEMASWWASMFEVPAVVVAGKSLEDCTRTGMASIEFIALRSAVWDHAEGPRIAVQQATALLANAIPEESIYLDDQ